MHFHVTVDRQDTTTTLESNESFSLRDNGKICLKFSSQELILTIQWEIDDSSHGNF